MFNSFQRPAGSRIHRHNHPTCRGLDFHPSLGCCLAVVELLACSGSECALFDCGMDPLEEVSDGLPFRDCR